MTSMRFDRALYANEVKNTASVKMNCKSTESSDMKTDDKSGDVKLSDCSELTPQLYAQNGVLDALSIDEEATLRIEDLDECFHDCKESE